MVKQLIIIGRTLNFGQTRSYVSLLMNIFVCNIHWQGFKFLIQCGKLDILTVTKRQGQGTAQETSKKQCQANKQTIDKISFFRSCQG